MKKGFLTVAYPQNATEQAAVPVGQFAILPGESEVKQKSATGEISSVGGGGVGGKAQLTTAGSNALTYSLHNGKEVHCEAGVTAVTMALADFQVSGENVFGSFYLFNYTGSPLPLSLTGLWFGGISEDGEAANDLFGAGTLVTIPHSMKALVIFDADKYVRASILGSEVTQTELNSKLTNIVSATDKILGRSTAGAGAIEEITKQVHAKGDSLVIELPFEWTDFGTWESLEKYYQANNIEPKKGEVVEIEAKDNFCVSDNKKKIAIIGVDNLIVVEGDDGILICRKDLSGRVGEVV